MANGCLDMQDSQSPRALPRRERARKPHMKQVRERSSSHRCVNTVVERVGTLEDAPAMPAPSTAGLELASGQRGSLNPGSPRAP